MRHPLCGGDGGGARCVHSSCPFSKTIFRVLPIRFSIGLKFWPRDGFRDLGWRFGTSGGYIKGRGRPLNGGLSKMDIIFYKKTLQKQQIDSNSSY